MTPWYITTLLLATGLTMAGVIVTARFHILSFICVAVMAFALVIAMQLRIPSRSELPKEIEFHPGARYTIVTLKGDDHVFH